MKNNLFSPESLFQKTKEWIATGQKANMDKNINIAESGKTPLNLLIEDVKADAPKHIKKLKVATAAAMIFGGNLAFNPNVAGANKTESNAASKTEAVKSDPIVDFTNSVFEAGGKNNSMSKGGTPIAIKHALQNDQQITSNEVVTIFKESAQINNGKTNPINQKEVKIKMSYYNNYINQGMNRDAALLRATVECHVNHPEISKGISNDFKVFLEVAQKCGITIESQKETIKNYINQGMEPQESIVKATLECIDKYPEIKNANLEDIKVLRSVAKKCGINLEPKPNSTKTPLQTLKEQNQVPKVAPSISPTPELKTKLPEKSSKNNPSESKPSFSQWAKDNQKSIDDFLKATGMLTIAGVATAAGLAAVHKMYKKYQQWEATLPPMMTKAEIKANFWINMEKFKQSELAQKIKNQTQKAQRASQRLVIPESASSQLQSVETNINPNELRPGIGQKWSNFIRGFRQKFVKVFEFTKSKLSSARQLVSNISSNTKTKIQENLGNIKSTFQGINEGISQKIETRKTNTATKKANQQEQQEQAQREEAANELKKQRAETIAKMENFEIPFVPYKEHKDSEDFLNRFIITADMITRKSLLKLTEADLEAISILTSYNTQIVIDNSKYKEQFDNAKVFLQNKYEKINKSKLIKFLEENVERKSNWCEDVPTSLKFPIYGAYPTFLLRTLKAQKEYFNCQKKIDYRVINALDVCIKLFEEITLEQKNKSKMWEIRYTMARPGEISNVNGRAEEKKGSFVEIANQFMKEYDVANNIKVESEFDKELKALIKKIKYSLFDNNIERARNFYIDSWIQEYKTNDLKPFDKINFDEVKALLNNLILLTEKYKIRTDRSPSRKLNDQHNNGCSINLSKHQNLLDSILTVQTKMQDPANEPGYPASYFETGMIADGPLSHDGGTCWSQKEVEYPESQLYPGLLDRQREHRHIIEIAKKYKIDLNLVRRVIQNDIPSSRSEQEICMWHYNKAIKYYNMEWNKYRHDRKSKPTYDNSPESMLIDPLLIKAYNDTQKQG